MSIGEFPTLYRRQTISVEELEKLKQNVGNIIPINGFFSTSHDINVARLFTCSVVTLNNYKSVLFEIHADPSVKWFRLIFPTPANLVSNSSNLYQVNMIRMYKGLLYINGRCIGRYLTINTPTKDPVPPCDYRGPYTPLSKCRYDWGKPTQILYHFSAHLLNNNGKDNELIIFEETDVVPTQAYIEVTALESSY